ncbi:MAG TPA: DAK2 domain-containing protein [Thermoleophilaceae bacterium]|jgi:DAK2 domain fusion protein YloV|nr:DAK2 domain-containing protein [Thermoleophilaceae bacterium]
MPADDSLARFRRVVAAALNELENRRQEVNDLNVFPVADGDTGDNMALTMRAVLEALNALDGSTIDDIRRDEIVSAVARAALLGARGNSGVILSQVVRGAAEELASRPGELVDPVLVSAAFARAADAAYASVRDPAEGTMLTAVRAMASRVAHDLAHMDTQRLGADASSEEQDELLAQVLENALEAGKEAVARGPEQLAVLRESGVVDAGAYGLTVIIAGCLAALRGLAAPQLEHQYAPAALHRPEHESSSFRYCTNFAVTGEGLEAGSFTRALEQLGDSVLVVGDDRTLRVHVHTDDPDQAVALFEPVGDVSRFDVADMHEQVADRSARLAGEAASAEQAACAVVAVASGEGVKRLFSELGVLVVDGGSTMNPSTYELLAGIHAALGAEVVVLPNSPNVILAAERACELSDKPAAVVPTTAPQEGLAALLAFDPGRGAGDNAAAVGSAAEALRIGGVAPAARDDAQGRFFAGDAVGYAGGELVAWGDPAATLAATLEQIVDGAELLTCIAGEAPPLGQDDVQASVPDGVELEYHEGGQPAWWWLLCAE